MTKSNVDAELLEFIRPKPNSSGSLYSQLARSISQAIHEGLLQDGDYLLPQRELAEVLDISRVTVRKAIQLLVDEGLLSQKQGSGTIVTSGGKQSIHKNLSVLNSFTEDMRSRGMEPSSEWVAKDIVRASPKEAMALNLSPSAQVCRFTRVRFASDTPMAYEIATVPATIINNVDDVKSSLYEALETRNARPTRALQTMTAKNADKIVASFLKIAESDAVLYIERQGFNDSNTPIEFTRSWYRGDIYDFVAELQLS